MNARVRGRDNCTLISLMRLLESTLKSIGDLDEKAMEKARKRLDTFLKPPGSLGKLEHIAVQLAGITGKVHNSISKKIIIVMAADNGVIA